MVLGLRRIFVLTWTGIFEAYRRNSEKKLPWKEIALKTLEWLIPVRRLWTSRPVYSTTSFLFHASLIVTPLFLVAHNLLWKKALGYSLPSFPQSLSNTLALILVISAVGLFLGRVLHRGARSISTLQDFFWPLAITLPFATGYLASNRVVSSHTYQLLILLHIYASNLLMVMIPFTKIAHCVLTPLSQLVTHLAWKFAPGAGDLVAETLGYGSRPTWLAGARLNVATTSSAAAVKEVSHS